MTIDATNDLQSARRWPGMRSEHAWLAPHEGFSVTGTYQIGASFTNHRDLVFHHAGHESVRNVQAGAVFVTGAEGIAWSRVLERTEALEIYPDLQLLEDTARQHGRRELTIEPAAFVKDPVVLSVAATLKRVHITNAYLSDLAASTLAQRLADQIVDRYSGTSQVRAQQNAGRLGCFARAAFCGWTASAVERCWRWQALWHSIAEALRASHFRSRSGIGHRDERSRLESPAP